MTKGRKTTFDERVEIAVTVLYTTITMPKQQKNTKYPISRPATIQ